MPERKVGKVPLGCFEVDLYLDSGLHGGSCSMTDRKVVIGLAMEATARAAMFVTKALPVVAGAWNKLHKRRKAGA